MRHTLISLGILTLLVGGASAAPTSTVTALVEDDGAGAAGLPDQIGDFTNATDSDPNSLARLTSGTYVYFEAEDAGGIDPTRSDAITLFNPSLSGTARFTVIGTDASISAVSGLGAIALGCEDLAVDRDTDDVYGLMTNTTPNPDNIFIIRIPSLGVGTDTFGPPELFASNAVVGDRNGAGAIEISRVPNPNELIIVHDTQTTANDNTTNIVARRPVTAASNDPHAQTWTFATVAAGTTPASSFVGGDLIGFTDLAILPDGDYILHNSFGDTTPSGGPGSTDGDIVRWDPGSSTASLWLEGNAVGNATQRAPMATLSNGDIALWLFDTPNAPLTRDIVRFDSAGVLRRIVATQAQTVAAVSTPPAQLSQIGNAFATDGGLEFAVFHNADPETLIEVVDTDVPVELSVFRAD